MQPKYDRHKKQNKKRQKEWRKFINRLRNAKGSNRGVLYSIYLRSPQWKSIRQQALRRDGFKCTSCGSSNDLTVHHMTYANIGQELLEDLTSLCDTCHSRMHGRSAIFAENIDILQLRHGVERKPIVDGHGHRTSRTCQSSPTLKGNQGTSLGPCNDVNEGLNVANSGGSGQSEGTATIATLADSVPISAASRSAPHRIPHKTQTANQRRNYFRRAKYVGNSQIVRTTTPK